MTTPWTSSIRPTPAPFDEPFCEDLSLDSSFESSLESSLESLDSDFVSSSSRCSSSSCSSSSRCSSFSWVSSAIFLLSQGLGPAHDFHDFLCDVRLPLPVGLKREVVD